MSSDSAHTKPTVVDAHAPRPSHGEQTESTEGEHSYLDRPEELDGAQLPRAPMPDLVSSLGKGGMAEVRLAFDAPLARNVALKHLHDGERDDLLRQRAFVREARITGQLQHPNVVPVYSLATDDDESPYFTMQVIEGRDFRHWLNNPERKPGSRERIERGIEIILRVCDAVAYAHSRRVLHRDVKPDNIMVGPYGRVYLMDWGLAIACDSETAVHGARGVAGTPSYLSPEQARAEPVDERTDVFGLGATLYEVVAGRGPYQSPRGGSPLSEAAAGAVVPVEQSKGVGTISRVLAQIINRAVAPIRDDRYRTIEEFQTDLRGFLQGGYHLPRKTFQKGDAIVQQGQTGDAAYLILSGSCDVMRCEDGKSRKIRTMKNGEIFGEIALLLEEPRSASVVAAEPTKVLVIDRDAFDSRGVLDGWSSQLLRALAGRFRGLEEENTRLREQLAAVLSDQNDHL